MLLRLSSVLSAIVLLGSAGAGGRPALPPDLLWHTVKVCAESYLLTGIPFPCLDVQLQSDRKVGFAVVPVPAAAEVLLVPTERIAGIESPQLMLPEAPNWWRFAWEARHFLKRRAGSSVADNDVVLAINSERSRSQNQLHIHVACIRPGVARQIRRREDMIRSTWSHSTLRIQSEKWFVMRLIGKDLQTDPFALLADLKRNSTAQIEGWSLAVLSWTFADGTDGFVVLASNEPRPATGSIAKIIDPLCNSG